MAENGFVKQGAEVSEHKDRQQRIILTDHDRQTKKLLQNKKSAKLFLKFITVVLRKDQGGRRRQEGL